MQESYFQWCFGVTEADCFGVIEVDTGKATLFFPKLPEEYMVWMGEIHSLGHFKAKYAVEETKYSKDVRVVLVTFKIHLLTLNDSFFWIFHSPNHSSNNS